MMKWTSVWAMGTVLLTALAPPVAAADSPVATETAAGAQKLVNTVPVQDWELRRQSYWDMLQKLKTGDEDVRSRFEAKVATFEQRPFGWTPMEAMDLIGTVFLPNVPLEKIFPLIVAQAILGTYDAYRFASPEAQQLVFDGEDFYERAFKLAGPAKMSEALTFMRAQPARAAALVAEGVQIADNERAVLSYDTEWPAVYHRYANPCLMTGSNNCPPSTGYIAPKQAEWGALWKKSQERVTNYFQVKEAGHSRPSTDTPNPVATPAEAKKP